MSKTHYVALVLLSLCLPASLLAADQAKPAELKVGDVAPPFEMKGSDGKTYKLSDCKGKEAVVIAGYPIAFTVG